MNTIIKDFQASDLGQSAPFHFAEIGPSAGASVESTRATADQIIAEAHAQAATIRQAAHDEGSAAALEAAARQCDEKLQSHLATLLPAISALSEEIAAAKTAWLAHWERAAIQVAAAIAGRVVRRELSRSPEITLSLVQEALELAAGTSDIQLRMNPLDVASLGPCVEKLVADLGRLGKTQVVADERITAGGCRVDTRFGSIDQQFEAQLARIQQELA
ncbi:MAG TPA: FliH/SctL family protein [Pirellulales bacterium]|jgi:flagellar biosynthesis/type III secretory pathway protein FliH|nr:FliH/SctL family protein [Pirellulales bacterium]